MALSFRNPFNKREGQAFPGDTYLADMHEAARSGKPWARSLFLAVILGFLADLYFLHDTTNYAFNIADADALSFLVWLVAGALVFLYLFIGHVFGKKLQDYIVFRDKLSLASAIVALLILVIALVALTIFRLSADANVPVITAFRSFFVILGGEQYRDAVSAVFVMTLIMLLSAYVSALHAYYSGDAVSEAVYRKSVAALPADRAMYNRVFFEHTNDIERERQYEERERELDKRAVESAFALGSLASQLNGMVDPADAYEFMQAQRAIAAEYFGEGDR